MKKTKITSLFLIAVLLMLAVAPMRIPASAASNPSWMSAGKDEITMFKEYQVAFSDELFDGVYHCRVFTFELPENGDIKMNLEETRHDSLFFSNCSFEFFSESNTSTPVLTWKDINADLNASGESYLGSASGSLNAGKYFLLVKIEDHYYQQAQGFTFLFNFDFTPHLTTPTITKTKAYKKKITVKWPADPSATSYEIQCSTKKDFRPTATRTETVSTPKATSYTIKKLKKKTRYFIRIRAVHSVNFFIVGEKQFVTPWSATRGVKTKKA